ncbi:flagellar protein FlgN [Bacillus salacetis]|uniref:Flagellar protein FlgN n=1 Tax=Bacillus salacetis TaxID=2315464 RepID=A0A3A1RDN4_9BACI|nr:flagellar protein FlgN [Bacillus salacetis]RIW39065.1 flagellar protein FlgN [Bacillus salacetis]
MQAQSLITTLEKLHKLHRSLYDLSLEKTDSIKKGNTEALNDFIKKEQNHISAINTLENQRQKLAADFLLQRGASAGTPNLSEVIRHADDGDKPELERLKAELLALTVKLREQNELNQKLVYQSLQFVNMNLSMLQPQPEQTNYSRPTENKGQPSQKSMFDSKA